MNMTTITLHPEIEIQALKARLTTSETNNERLAERCEALQREVDNLRHQWAEFVKRLSSRLPNEGAQVTLHDYRAICEAAFRMKPLMIEST